MIAEELPVLTRVERGQGAIVAAAAALVALVAWRGFTVDDALVSARVASHLAGGLGYRFNSHGPAVDAVTPLGWAHLLALFGPASPLDMLARGRLIGSVAWLAGAALLGALAPAHRLSRLTVSAALLLSAPLGAWASSGMETGLVTLCATLALLPGAPGVAAAGLAAAWRPELLAWAAALGGGSALVAAPHARERLRALGLHAALAVGPAVAVACLRKSWFGSFAPLSVVAKPSDLAHGAFYAVGAFVGCGLPLLLLAPRALARADARTRLLAVAVATHFVALVLAGGDWMALYRLAVPVLPTAILAAARLATGAAGGWLLARSVGAAAGCIAVAVGVALPGRHVFEHRLALIEQSRPLFAGRRSVACLDVGWVGAATDAPLLDLAGITDPLVARLPGGHTSKRVQNGLFENRDVDAVVLLLAPGERPAERWQESAFARQVEQRVAALPAVSTFRLRGVLPLAGTNQRYLLAVR